MVDSQKVNTIFRLIFNSGEKKTYLLFSREFFIGLAIYLDVHIHWISRESLLIDILNFYFIFAWNILNCNVCMSRMLQVALSFLLKKLKSDRDQADFPAKLNL